MTRAWKRISGTRFVFGNAVGIALYGKFGFEIEGTYRSFASRDGEYVGAYSMVRLKPPAPVA